MSGVAKRVKDIRYFESSVVPGYGQPLPSNGGSLLEIPTEAHRLGQRIACLLGARGVSVGDYDHIYVCFTPALPPNAVHVTNFGFEPWHRYVAYGADANFKQWPQAEKLSYIEEGTLDCVKALAPSWGDVIADVRERLRTDGTRTRVLRLSKQTSAYELEVWFDVPAIGDKAYLYLTARDRKSGRLLQAPPIPLADFEHAYPLVSSITMSKGSVNLVPRSSFKANLSVDGYDAPIRVPLAQFHPVTE